MSKHEEKIEALFDELDELIEKKVWTMSELELVLEVVKNSKTIIEYKNFYKKILILDGTIII